MSQVFIFSGKGNGAEVFCLADFLFGIENSKNVLTGFEKLA